MISIIIDGKLVSETILNNLKNEVSELNKKGIFPGLAVILVGNNASSKIYVNNKKKACQKIGIYSEEYILPENTNQKELIKLIQKLNADTKIDGILVQLPLPKHIDEVVIADAISPTKDVDVFNSFNLGRILIGNSGIYPCTPTGIVELLNYYNIEIEGKHCVILGRSNIVGKPLSLIMLKNNATVTICHSKTENLEKICKQADILIIAIGKSKFINKNMVKNGAVVIDVGINRSEIGNISGDVDFENVKDVAKYITPVPGGVGPMTIAMLMKNTVIVSKNHVLKSNM